jgi:hypothetical protein
MTVDQINSTAGALFGLVPMEQRPAASRLVQRYASDLVHLRTAYYNRDVDAQERLLPRLRADVAAIDAILPPERRPAAQVLVDEFSEHVIAYADAELAKPQSEQQQPSATK